MQVRGDRRCRRERIDSSVEREDRRCRREREDSLCREKRIDGAGERG